MGKITGFMEYQRLDEHYDAPATRKTHYREFVMSLDDAAVKIQAARCMDCGTPFCNNGCPIHNVIPNFNDLAYRQQWRAAFEVLSSTNNFPEFTGRVCPAPCEAACTLGINSEAVGIKSIEHALIDKAWEEGWVTPQVAAVKTGKQVAVVGSGPAGLAAAQQLARAGHAVTVFEKRDRIGGLLRYGIPDFKLEKSHIDRRIAQMEAEGVVFKTSVCIGVSTLPSGVASDTSETMTAEALCKAFDAVILAGGSEVPRDLPVPGHELAGVHYAMEFLPQQNKAVAGDSLKNQLLATGKNVVVIGGGDTGSDCVGTSIRQGAKSVTQIELLPKPPEEENKALTWPYWPLKLRTSSSHEEGCTREWSVVTQAFKGKGGVLQGLTTARVEWQKDPKSGQMQMKEVPGSEKELPADLVLLAMGFVNPVGSILDAFGVSKDGRGNVEALTEGANAYATNVGKVFAAGDMRRGQSLVVWAIQEGRQCAQAVDIFLREA